MLRITGIHKFYYSKITIFTSKANGQIRFTLPESGQLDAVQRPNLRMSRPVQ